MNKKELLKNYYINNPEAEIRARKSRILSTGLASLAVPASIAIFAKKRGLPISKLTRQQVAGLGAIGATLPISAFGADRAVSRNLAMKNMGVDESMLGSYLAPFKEKFKLD